MKALIIFIIVMYDAFLLSGTAYLITEKGWSMWTFLLTAIFFLSYQKMETPVKANKKLTAEDIFSCKDC